MVIFIYQLIHFHLLSYHVIPCVRILFHFFILHFHEYLPYKTNTPVEIGKIYFSRAEKCSVQIKRLIFYVDVTFAMM